MKNLKSKTVSVLLAALMLFTLFGCSMLGNNAGGSATQSPEETKPIAESDKPEATPEPEISNEPGASDQEKFVGTWRATVDLTDLMNESIQQGLGEDDLSFSEYFQISKFDFVMVFTFRDDGTYSAIADEAQFNQSIQNILDEIKVGMRRYLEDMLAAEDPDLDLDDLLASEGLSIDSLIDENLPISMFDGIADSISVTGKWKIKNGRLYTTGNAYSEIDDSDYELYEFVSSDEIRLTLPVGAIDDTGFYPITLKRST